ncbi:MAG: hypothetical protein FWF84_03180, partial [Kiritimatiellaeota bacterium]|nr:hypothetical protein [Kiritimatiellota bacterium]
KIDIASEFIAYQLSDFFTGALMLAGPQDGNGGAFGLYNPWWDAILLFQTKGALPESGDDKVVAPKVERFALLSGETFRGEKAATPGTATVMPGKDPFSTAIWRVQAATVKRFEAVYGESLEDPVQLRLATTWGAVDNRVEFERIQVRSAIRMKLALMLNKNSQDTAIAARVTDVLCNGSALRLKKHFQSQPHASFVKRLTELPGAFRAGFTVYGYVPTEAGSLFVFVNRQMPRFYATVSMPAGRIGDRSKGPVIFEWYDLASAAELITAWDNETKGGAQ